MSLTLYFHPLASYCHKVLVGLYENDTPFTPRIIDLGDAAQRAELAALWPICKFPVLHDATRDRLVPESSLILEYLDEHHRGPVRLLPEDPDDALTVRHFDRCFDLYVQGPMQKIVGDKLRDASARDPHGVDEARAALRVAYTMLERRAALRGEDRWFATDAFSMADCSAAPALFYANELIPLADEFPALAGYLRRLEARPAFARVLAEARPYWASFPG